MRIGYCLLLSALACNAGDPQVDTNTSIVGRVVDAETGEALAQVRITTMPATTQVETDASGDFIISEGPKVAQRYQATASLDGFESVTKTVTTVAIAAGTKQENRVDFELTILKICTPGAKRCALGIEEESVETCGQRGNGWVPMTCSMDQVCSPEQSACVPGHLLTVQSIGQGSGAVISSPGGINCGQSCEKSFPEGTTVTLTATPFALSGFGGWTGACTGTDLTCTVTIDDAKTVAARFDSTGYLLIVEPEGFGGGRVTSDPAGIYCGHNGLSGAVCEYGFEIDATVTLEAVSAANSTFGGWSGACSGTGVCTVTLDQARTVGASFETQTYALAVTKAGMGAGTITSDPAGIDCGANCTSEFLENEVVTLTAAPEPSSSFVGWSGACTGTGDCVVTMDQARSVTATFDGVAFAVTVARMGSGAGRVVSTPSGIDCGAVCSSSYGPGAQVTLTATPDPGSAFGGWGGACSGTSATCMVTVDAALNVTAQFDVGNISLTVAVTGPGSVTSNPAGINCGATCNASFAGGAQVALTAAPQGATVFGGWGGACSSAGVNLTCMLTLTMNANVSAVFDPFYLRPLVADASCTDLFSFDNPTPLVDECGGGAAAVLGGATWTQISSRATALNQAYQASGGEEGFIETNKSAPAPGNATFELTVRKAGAAFAGRARAVLYSDRDALAPGAGVRLMVLDDGSIFFETRGNAGAVSSATAAAALTNATWAHVAATVSTANGLRIFVDGAQLASTAGPIQWTASSSTAWIGAQREGAAGAINRFNGDIDEVRVSNTVRY